MSTLTAAGLDRDLRALGDEARAEHDRTYLRSSMVHYGVSVPKLRAAVKAAYRMHARLSHESLLGLVEALWGTGVYECRLAAVELLVAHVELLSPTDLAMLRGLLSDAMTWALVDALAINVVGVLLAAVPEEVAPVMGRWITDPDMWVRRSALLAEIPGLRRGQGDLSRFAGHADQILGEKEFFMRKATGWVLREASKHRPDDVAAFVRARIDRISGVALREAVRHLPAAQREELVGAYRGRQRRAGPEARASGEDSALPA